MDNRADVVEMVRNDLGDHFDYLLLFHIQNENCAIYKSQTAFGMARKVDSSNAGAMLDLTAHHENPDCWFITTAAGDIRELVSILPDLMPYIAFTRRRDPNKIKFYQTYKLLKRWDSEEEADAP